MAYAELTPLQKNSLPAKTTSLLTDVGTEVEVDDQSVFYRDSVLLTKGWVLGPDNSTESYTEEVTVSATDAATGAGTVTLSARAIKADGTNGAAREWPIGTTIKNTYTTGVHDQIRDNFAAQRTRLTANTTYYVATTGNDTTGDGTSGTPWATIQKAYNYICASLDLAGYAVTIQLADGTYTGATAFSQPWTGGGSVTIQGNTANTGGNYSVIISCSTTCFSVDTTLPGSLSILYLKMQTTAASLISHTGIGTIIIHQINFGACTGNHILITNTGATVSAYGKTYYISGGGGYAHLNITNGGFFNAGWSNINMAASITMAYFANASAGVISLNSSTITVGAYVLTGTKYYIILNGVCETGGLTLPGSVAGSVATGGQYT
jgi:hypothetical protein